MEYQAVMKEGLCDGHWVRGVDRKRQGQVALKRRENLVTARGTQGH